MKTLISYPKPFIIIVEPTAEAGSEVEKRQATVWQNLRQLLYRSYLCNTRFAEDGAIRFSDADTLRHIEDWVNVHTHYPELCFRCRYCDRMAGKEMSV